MNLNTIMINLIRDEGLGRPGQPGVAYKDSVGKLTVGAGRNLEDVGLTFRELADIVSPDRTAQDLCEKIALTLPSTLWTRKQRIFFKTHAGFHRVVGKENLTEADMKLLLEHDIQRAVNSAETLLGDDWGALPTEAQEVIVQVIFNLGLGGFSKFRKCILAMRNHDWRRAAEELLDSKAARQTGTRYHRYANTLRALPAI